MSSDEQAGAPPLRCCYQYRDGHLCMETEATHWSIGGHKFGDVNPDFSPPAAPQPAPQHWRAVNPRQITGLPKRYYCCIGIVGSNTPLEHACADGIPPGSHASQTEAMNCAKIEAELRNRSSVPQSAPDSVDRIVLAVGTDDDRLRTAYKELSALVCEKEQECIRLTAEVERLRAEIADLRVCDAVIAAQTDRETGYTDVSICENKRPCADHPPEAIYHMQGQVEGAEEAYLNAKAEREGLAALVDAIATKLGERDPKTKRLRPGADVCDEIGALIAAHKAGKV